jgi:hypothetical protein
MVVGSATAGQCIPKILCSNHSGIPKRFCSRRFRIGTFLLGASKSDPMVVLRYK